MSTFDLPSIFRPPVPKFRVPIDSSDPNLAERLWAAEASGFKVDLKWSPYDVAFLSAACAIRA